MNTRLRCLLLDDELPGLALLKLLCEEMPEVEVVKAFNNPNLFLQDIQKLDFDVCILDIEMPGTNGLEVARSLQGKPVIFTTAYKDFAADAFELDAIDYVIKPVKRERLHHAIKKAGEHLARRKSEEATILHNTDQGRSIIQISQIAYVKTSDGDSRDKIVHMRDGTSLTLKNINFDALSQELSTHQICRINRKEMLARSVVKSYTSETVNIIIPAPVPRHVQLTLSETYRSVFLQMMQN